MKRLSLLCLLLLSLVVAGCRAAGPAENEGEPVAVEATRPAESEAETPATILPLLPPLVGGEGNVDALPGDDLDPFAEATFTLNAELPAGRDAAVVEQHTFGRIDEARARFLADQFGFTGPLYRQDIPPEFAPLEEENLPLVFTAFDGRRILNISDSGLTYEDRAVAFDSPNRPTTAAAAAMAEEQLRRWELLDFPYERREVPGGGLAFYRLVDGVPTNLNEFNLVLNGAGEVRYFDYRPLRQIERLGDYPLISAETAWQQLQDPATRARIRFHLMPAPAGDDTPPLVNPRYWVPQYTDTEVVHVYATPVVYRAANGAPLRILMNHFLLRGSEAELQAISGHLSDVLHISGSAGEENGEPTLTVAEWEAVDFTGYVTVEGVIAHEGGQALIETAEGERLFMSAAPDDLPDGLAVYVNTAARRENDSGEVVLDWDNITEKIEFEPVPMMPDEPAPAIERVAINGVELIYFTFYEMTEGPAPSPALIFVPVWQFSGRTDRGQIVTFWVTAVEPDYLRLVDPDVGPPPYLDIYELGADLVKETALPDTDPWHIAPCEGFTPLFCVTGPDGESGFVELLTLPLENQPEFLSMFYSAGLTPGQEPESGDDYAAAAREALAALADFHLDRVEEDRAISYPEGTFTRLETRPVLLGSLPALAFGFVHTDVDGNVVERYLDIAAFDRTVLYWLGANSDPANFTNFNSDAALLEFAPYLPEVAAGIPVGR